MISPINSKYIKRTARVGLAALLITLLLVNCRKDSQVFDNPYAGGRQQLGVKLSTDPPDPVEAAPGTVVTFKATGLVPYKDSLRFTFNAERAEVVSVDTTGIKVKVPVTGSTGVASVTIGDQIYFGPIFRVKGSLDLDPNYKATIGANGPVNEAYQMPDGRMLLLGGFWDFERKGVVKPLNRIVLTSKDGEVDRNLLSGKGADGSLGAIAALPGGKLVITGSFSSYDTHNGEMRNITLLNSNGSLDSVIVNTYTKKDTVPSFNGGTDGNIYRAYVHDNKITCIGNFNYYLSYVYNKPDFLHERDSLITDSVVIRQLIRFYPDGRLDSTFNYDLVKHKSFDGANGPISDAYMQPDGKLIIVGRFTKYNGQPAPYIARLNTDGSLDAGFGGSGADNTIYTIRYNAAKQRFMLAGDFTRFNGADKSGLVMLKTDGSIDNQFAPLPVLSGTSYLFAQQLNNGLVIVSGYFKQYGNVRRSGFMVLNPDASLAAGYNNTGDFRGYVSKVVETTSANGQTQALVLGMFSRFNEKDAGNIFRLLFK